MNEPNECRFFLEELLEMDNALDLAKLTFAISA